MKLLIVVDFQNDFISGALGFPKAQTLEKGIYDKIKAYKEDNDDVLFTFDTHHENYLETQEGRNLPITHCIKDTWGWDLPDSIKELNGYKIIKNTFGAADLVSFLKNTFYEEIELVGLVSNICVISNAVLAKTATPETKIVVDASLTASFDEGLHEKALDVMTGLQIEVINRGENNE